MDMLRILHKRIRWISTVKRSNDIFLLTNRSWNSYHWNKLHILFLFWGYDYDQLPQTDFLIQNKIRKINFQGSYCLYGNLFSKVASNDIRTWVQYSRAAARVKSIEVRPTRPFLLYGFFFVWSRDRELG